MEIDPPPKAGPPTFRPTPALGVTYLLDTEEEDIKQIIPLPPVDDTNDKDYDPRADQGIDEDDSEEGPPYPTPSSIVHGKRKAAEVYDVDEEWPRQSDRLRKKKARLQRSRPRKEPAYICISSDSDDDVVQIPKPAEKKQQQKRQDPPPKPPIAASKQKSEHEQDTGPLDEASASPDPEAEMGSVERLRPDPPNWVEMQLAKVRKEHRSAKLELCYHYSIEGDVWRVQCRTCPRNAISPFCSMRQTCSVGPGQSLGYLSRHLKGAAHQAALGNSPSGGSSGSSDARKAKFAPRRDPSPRPAPDRDHGHVAAMPATANRREKAAEQDSGDDVERFLDQIGLPVDLAPKLRSVGFESDTRMNQIGRLADESLGLLLEHLKQEGVDIVTAIMVREGLKRRAGTL